MGLLEGALGKETALFRILDVFYRKVSRGFPLSWGAASFHPDSESSSLKNRKMKIPWWLQKIWPSFSKVKMAVDTLKALFLTKHIMEGTDNLRLGPVASALREYNRIEYVVSDILLSDEVIHRRVRNLLNR